MARNQNVTQVRVNTQAAFRDTQNIEEVAFFDADGNVLNLGAQGVHVAPVTTAVATDLPTAIALANANKVAINALLTSLQNARLIASS
jgi:hypothetical protein